MARSVFASLVLLFVVACASPTRLTQQQFDDILRTLGTNTPETRADTVALCLDKQLADFPGLLASSKRRLLRTAAVGTAVAVIGVSWASSTDDADKKADIAVGTASIGAVVGLVQAWYAADSDSTAYVAEAGKALADYFAAKTEAPGDAEKTEAAVAFLRRVGELKKAYPEYADFAITRCTQ